MMALTAEVGQLARDGGQEAAALINRLGEAQTALAERHARLSRSRFVSLEELMAITVAEPTWVVPGYLAQGLSLLAGRPKQLPRLDQAGRLALAGVEAVTVEKQPAAGSPQVAFAVVRWADQTTGAGLTQTYRLGVTRDGQRWLVASLGAATPTPERPANPKKEK